ncbi:MAG: extracellular solute-binding protein [Acidimicrobiia bacterium]|nr:extracellular solute-binding protein [Acidimicrobiia bacterium]
MHIRRRTFRSIVIALTVGALTAAACGDDSSDDESSGSEGGGETSPSSTIANSNAPAADAEWQAVVDAAKEEGKVLFYSGLPEAQHELIAEGFAEMYPDIELEIVRVQTRDLGGRIEVESEGGVGGADVIYSNSWAVWDPLEERGLLRELESPWIEARADTWSEHPELRMTENTAVFSILPYWIVWNSNLVEEPITSYEDLLSRADEFRGQVGAPDFLGVASQSWYAQLEEKMSGIDIAAELVAGNTLPEGYLRRFGELEPVIRDTALPLTQAVAAGEIKATIYTVPSIIDDLKAAGAPLEAAMPSDAIVVNAVALGLPTWGENPNAAQLVADFLLSDKGQEVNIEEQLISLDGSADELAVPGRELSNPEFLAAFERYWTEAMR